MDNMDNVEEKTALETLFEARMTPVLELLEKRLQKLEASARSQYDTLRAWYFVILDVLVPANVVVATRDNLDPGEVPPAMSRHSAPRLLYNIPSGTLWLLNEREGRMVLIMTIPHEIRAMRPDVFSKRPAVGPRMPIDGPRGAPERDMNPDPRGARP